MNYNHLYYFYVASKSGGITAAAEHLHISQPSLSSQLKVLEESLDVKLFEKVGRRNKLTPMGETIYGFCRQMFELAESMTMVMTKNTPSEKRKIQIGVSPEVEKEFVTEVVTRFLSGFESALRPQVNLVTGSLKQLIDQLHFKEVDTIITSQTIEESATMHLETIDIPVVLCCSNQWSHPKYTNTTDNENAIKELKSCNDIQWVLPSSYFHLRSQIDSFFEVNGIEKRIVFESDNFSTLARSVHNELGFSFLPLLYISNEIKRNSLKRLGALDGFWKYQITLGYHSQNSKDGVVNAFSKSFRELCEQVGPPLPERENALGIAPLYS